MLAAGDEIHAHITCTDAEGNDTMKIDDLASSLPQMLLGPCYTSVAVYRPKRQAAVDRHPCGLWPQQRVELRGCLQLRRSRLKATNQEGKLLGTAHPVAAILE